MGQAGRRWCEPDNTAAGSPPLRTVPAGGSATGSAGGSAGGSKRPQLGAILLRNGAIRADDLHGGDQSIAEVTGGDPDLELIQPVAVNYALTGLLRAVPFHARQRRCFLPADMMERYGIQEESLYDLKPEASLPDLVQEIHAQIIPDIRPENRFLKLSQELSMMYAQQIRRLSYDVFSPRLSLPPAFRELRLLRQNFS